MNFIKKIFDGESDGLVHLQFQKFSKGEFRDRALIEVKKSKKTTIKTSAEFANELVMNMAGKLGENIARVTGCVVSTNDLTGELDFKDKKQFQGVKRYIIDKEMTGNEIKNLLEKFPKTFFALSFKANDENELKIKPKAPKSGKPGKEKEGGPKADFCTLKTNDSEIVKSFIFEKENFKEARVNHTFLIERIEIPDELKDSKDFARIREESRRAGKIIRKAEIDGISSESEKEFAA